MNITANRLTATAGLCAAAAGAIFIGVQINHPPVDVAHVVTTEMTIREMAKALMCVLALAGITGMFVRHRDRFGVLGVAGYLLLSVGFLAMFANQCIVACVLPTVAQTDPGYVQAYIDAAMGHSPSGDIGHMQQLFLVSGIGYSLGGLLFGIALFRAGVLARWASRAARLRHHLRPGAGRAAGVLQPPVRGAGRRRADRPRRLAVARPAAPVRGRGHAGDVVGRAAGDAMISNARTTYSIRVEGHLDDHWSGWLGGLEMTRDEDGATTVTVQVADQAQLHGVLAGLRDIGAVIVELRVTDPR